ncbi:MAG TPA: ubiquinone/menaquinone biosynthesis methyltransferase [Solirubrobacteraceae bacterium]|nr:ubiquinone/menaquinone biosynthesis methyltransferase [Solirubrobacteraceae bacterium]
MGSGPPTGSAQGRLEAEQVRSMFDGIAGVYDLLNTAMTAGLHHRWRERAAQLARVRPGDRVLDVATGTGDLALALAAHVAPGGEVIGSDFSEAMLEHAREKVAQAQGVDGTAVRPRFEWGDALALQYEDDSFDAATVGFGARNFADLGRGLQEMRRVVRPGGRVVVLEITTPTRPPLSTFYALWFDRVVPVLGRVVQALVRAALAARARGLSPAAGRGHNGNGNGNGSSGHGAGSEGAGIADAYNYLPNSVKRFPEPRALAAELERAGLREISYVLLAGGIVAIHAGIVPASTSASAGGAGR